MRDRAQHPIDVSRGADIRKSPTPNYVNEAWDQHIDAIPIRYSKRRYGNMLILATGFTPWGTELDPAERPAMPWCDTMYVLCCGQTLTKGEAQEFVNFGLLQAGEPDRFRRPTLVITPAGRDWLNRIWNR